MKRNEKILMNALNQRVQENSYDISKVGNTVVSKFTELHFQVPKFEVTNGLESFERDIVISNSHKLFDMHRDIERHYDASIRVRCCKKTNKIQKNVLNVLSDKENSDSAEEQFYEDSSDDYIPDTDDISSESDRNSHSDDSEFFFVKNLSFFANKRNRKVASLDDHSKIENILSEIHSNDSDIEIKAQSSIQYNMSKKSETLQRTEGFYFHLNQGISEKKLPKKRIWNKRDYCFYCDDEVLKFSRHLIRHHQNELEVQEILAIRVGDRKRKFLFNKLRNRGNFLKSTTENYIVPVRKPEFNIPEKLDSTSYLPCKFCKGFYKKKFLYRHVKKCPHNKDSKLCRINAQSEGQSLFSSYRNNDILRTEIFPSMRADEISFTAKTDNLICAVAERYLKSHREKDCRQVASRKMRQLASLLNEIRKKTKIKNLLEALDPINFDIIIECTKTISKYDSETKTYGAPSLASNMGTLLKDAIDVAHNISLKKYQNDTQYTSKLKSLKDLIQSDWRYEISTLANNDLQRKQWNKPSLIPLAEDLTLLRSYLLKESDKFIDALQINPYDEKAFKNLTEINYVQLLLLNRRRVGELQKMTVSSFENNIDNKYSNEFNNCISESEKLLMKSFKRVVIRGKRGRGVPVLFTDQMVKATRILLEVRENFIRGKNIYLFANLNSASSISGTKTVYKHVRLAKVKNPSALTSTRLRKHLATMSQVINLNQQDLEQLANFMGHTSEIHKNYYRLPNDIYQMAKVSKLLLLNEKGEASKFKGKSLDEIEIDFDVMEEETSDDMEFDNITDIGENVVDNTTACKLIKEKNIIMKGKDKRVLEPWTPEQKKVTLDFFKHHLESKIAPKKKECSALKNQNPELLGNKTWEKVKIFVVNNYNKKTDNV